MAKRKRRRLRRGLSREEEMRLKNFIKHEADPTQTTLEKKSHKMTLQPADLMLLQKKIGNQAVQRLIAQKTDKNKLPRVEYMDEVISVETKNGNMKLLLDDLMTGAEMIEEEETTAAGRALQEIAVDKRGGDLFPKPTGSVAQINAMALSIIREMLHDEESTMTVRETEELGEVLDILSKEGRGMRFSVRDGRLIGFFQFEPKT